MLVATSVPIPMYWPRMTSRLLMVGSQNNASRTKRSSMLVEINAKVKTKMVESTEVPWYLVVVRFERVEQEAETKATTEILPFDKLGSE